MAVKEKWKGTRPITLSTQAAVERVMPVVMEKEGILVFYLFGSRARGEGTGESDIDFAFFSTREFSWDDYYGLRGSFSKLLGTDRFNLLWLNKADAIITFEVVTTGRPLFFRDPEVLNDLELRAKKNYYDYKLYLERRRRGL